MASPSWARRLRRNGSVAVGPSLLHPPKLAKALALTKMAPPLLTETDPLGGECLFSFQGGGSGWGGRLMKIPLPCLDSFKPFQ